jgi:hypothetical protein
LADVRQLPRGDAAEAARAGWARTKLMLAEILAISQPERRVMRDSLSRDEVGFLFGVARSGAEYAIREQSGAYLIAGFFALVIEDLQDDCRESVMYLCLLNHSAGKIGVDLMEIHRSLRVYESPEMESFLDNWFCEGTKDIGGMGYVEGVSKNGAFAYVRTW